MPVMDRLTQVFESSQEIEFNQRDKFILFSDCHRGDNSWADDFADNQLLYFYALQRYLYEGFTYIEIGDGDEIWENKDLPTIMEAHSHVFWLLNEFLEKNCLYMIHGNHDIERRDKSKMAQSLNRYLDQLKERGREKPWVRNFIDMDIHEGLKLRYSLTGQTLFLVHGHQADPINDRYWWIGRFFTGNLWKHLQLVGIKDPTSPAQNYNKMNTIEARIKDWIKWWTDAHQGQTMLVAGHTHRPRFPNKDQLPYFNTGSCVHPRCITGIEIQNGEISLIKWWLTVTGARGDEGNLAISKEIMKGPVNLENFYFES